MKQRILYFDWIKGLAIILVVMGHLYTFSGATSGNLINKLIGSFHMPLFMYVSGFVAFTPPDNLESLIIKLLRRSVKYLVPMYVVGWLLYLFASYTVASDNAILHSVKGTVWFGNWYWYLKVLTIFSLLSIPVMYKSKIWIDLLCICCSYILFGCLWKFGDAVGQNLCMEHATCFYPFFALGMMTRKYNRLHELIKTDLLFAISIVGYAYLFFNQSCVHIVNTLSDRFLMPVFAIVIISNIFCKLEEKQSKVLQGLEYCGKHSLQVYLFHYFFVLFVNIQGLWLCGVDTKNNLYVHLLILFVSIVIAVLSIMVGEMLKSSKYISKIIYG